MLFLLLFDEWKFLMKWNFVVILGIFSREGLCCAIHWFGNKLNWHSLGMWTYVVFISHFLKISFFVNQEKGFNSFYGVKPRTGFRRLMFYVWKSFSVKKNLIMLWSKILHCRLYNNTVYFVYLFFYPNKRSQNWKKKFGYSVSILIIYLCLRVGNHSALVILKQNSKKST